MLNTIKLWFFYCLANFAVLFAAAGASAHSLEHGIEIAASDQPTRNSTRALIGAFRMTGDDDYLEQAWQAISPALRSDTPDVTVLIDAATIAQARHEFADAQRLLADALRQQPGNSQAWLMLAMIHTVTGDWVTARHACMQVRGLPLLATAACLAQVEQLQSTDNRWATALLALLQTAPDDAANPEMRAWFESVAGDVMVAQDPDMAIGWYRSSLRRVERAQVRAALVDALLRLGRLDDARSAVNAGAPSLPLTVRRFIIAKRSGQFSDVVDDVRAAHHDFVHWIEDNDWEHAREMARFYLDVMDRPALARQLAVKNLSLQKEAEDRLLERRTRGSDVYASAP